MVFLSLSLSAAIISFLSLIPLSFFSPFPLQLFDKIKESQPEVLQKVFAVKGDITMEGLGLSDEDEARLADEVNVLFHAAATINFTVSASGWSFA